MIAESINITVSAEFSDDKSLRFSLTKSWDLDKPKAMFVLINPSKADVVRVDNTFCNLVNESVDRGFGSAVLVNLFPYMATNPKELVGKYQLGASENLHAIKSQAELADAIFIAWGTEAKKYRSKKSEVLSILKDHIETKEIMCWFDKNSIFPKHLRIIGKDWTLGSYPFSP